MKKKILILILTLIIFSGISLSCFATNNSSFDSSVFDGQDDIEVNYTKKGTEVCVPSLYEKLGIPSSDYKEFFSVYPEVFISDSSSTFDLKIRYDRLSGWLNMDGASIKINDLTYKIKSKVGEKERYKNGVYVESCYLYLTLDTIDFFEALSKNKDEPVFVTINCAEEPSFELSQNYKDSIVKLYNLYCEAGGTNPSNMLSITNLHQKLDTTSMEIIKS